MTQKTMVIEDENTWPSEVVDFLNDHSEIFHAWETNRGIYPSRYDWFITGLRNILNNYSLIGYHCTRLTEDEISEILNNGMSLPNGDMLKKRIFSLVDAGLLPLEIASELLNSNQADEKYRANKIWFCFFDPHLGGEWGIRRFFRSWGGEALYNWHENNPTTGKALTKIGAPCIIEAIVPIKGFGPSFLDEKVARQYLINRGFETDEPTDHEDNCGITIPAQNILNIIRYPEIRFVELTKCDTWQPPLSI